VTEAVVECAIRIVEASSWTIARSLRDHKAPQWNDVAGQISYVESAMMRLGDADGWVQRSQLLRACQRLDAMALDGVLDRLRQEDRLIVAKVATGGRSGVTIKLK